MDQIKQAMKQILAYTFILFLPFLSFAQGNKGKVDSCAPMKGKVVCYTDDIRMNNASADELYKAISSWAKEEYAKDVFISNVSCNNARKSILISSKIELLLNETEKTHLKYKMYISCFDNNYKVEVKNLIYQYDPDNSNKMRTYPAEDVIADNGKGNKVASIKDPLLFCNATFFFVEGLLDNVFEAAKKH